MAPTPRAEQNAEDAQDHDRSDINSVGRGLGDDGDVGTGAMGAEQALDNDIDAEEEEEEEEMDADEEESKPSSPSDVLGHDAGKAEGLEGHRGDAVPRGATRANNGTPNCQRTGIELEEEEVRNFVKRGNAP
ncbi:hypothetical protein HDU96_008832 [Phlyctochytrium bullatum]|nr:hypothetical protein HDU96_008832 [Phlyctochytrium bullatum]